MKKTVIYLLFLITAATSVAAQDSVSTPASAPVATENYKPSIQLDKGTKVVYVQRLGLAPSTTLYEVLQLFPELLDRTSTQMLSNYSVQLDDQDVGSGKINLLMQLTISDVEKLEINENASASYAQNGATGSIGIISAPLSAGVSGYALCDVSTEAGTRVAGSVGYRTEKFTLRANVNGEYLRYEDSPQQQTIIDNHLITENDFFQRHTTWNQGAKLHMEYRPSTSDMLQVRLWENYSHTSSYEENESHNYPWLTLGSASFNQIETNQTNKALTLFAQAKYEHLFAANQKLGLSLNYTYSGSNVLNSSYHYINGMDSLFQDLSIVAHPHQGNADLYYDGTLCQKDRHLVKMKVGLQAACSSASTTYIDSTYDVSFPTHDTTFIAQWSMHASPYMELNYGFGDQLLINLGGRYRYEQLGKAGEVHPYHSYMVNLFLNYMPAKGHTLRVGALRNFLSPTFASATGQSYTANLRYIYGGNFGEHHLNTEAGLQYTHVNRLTDTTHFNVWQASVATYWSYRWISLSLAFSLFDNQNLHADNSLSYKGYYNIRFTPIFRLPKEWQISATLMYNSSQITENQTFGRYFYTALRLSKLLGDWNLHAELTDMLHYTTTDTYYYEQLGSDVRYLTTSYPYHRTFRIGVQYRF